MSLTCNTCKVRFDTREQLNAHYRSDFHRTNLVFKSKGQPLLNEEQFNELQNQKKVEEEKNNPKPIEMNEEEDKEEFHVELCRDIPLTECLFCGREFETKELAFEHMKNHGFRICYPEKLSDFEGLMTYFGEKVGVGHCCICCHKQFQSLKSVRGHMNGAKHCAYEYDEELDEFYQPETGIIPVNYHIDDNGELHLPNGKIYGHRKLQRYYKQHFTDIETFQKSARRAIAGPEFIPESIDIAQNRNLQTREFFKQKYINKRMMRIATATYHLGSDQHRGNAG